MTQLYFSSRWQYNQKRDKGVYCTSGMDVIFLFFIPKYYVGLKSKHFVPEVVESGRQGTYALCFIVEIHLFVLLCVVCHCSENHLKAKASKCVFSLCLHMKEDRRSWEAQNTSTLCWNSAALYPSVAEWPNLSRGGGNHKTSGRALG